MPGLHRRTVGDPAQAVLLLHGRGATADGMLDLGAAVADDALLLAPQAPDRTWYPRPFMQTVADNQPALDDALATVTDALETAADAGFPRHDTALVGFSQGACLATEYAARNAQRFNAVAGLSGGLIGAELDGARYGGDLAGTPVLLACSDSDPHIPVSRVHATADVLDGLGGAVDTRIRPGTAHTITDDDRRRLRHLLR